MGNESVTCDVKGINYDASGKSWYKTIHIEC